MKKGPECIFIMVDDDVDEIFFTRREIRKQGFINRFVAEEDPDNLFSTMDDLCELGEEPNSFFILLDMNMPGNTGIEVLKKIRVHDIYKNIPVIIFSGQASDDQKDKAIAHGANGFMVKPFSSDELFHVIDNISHVKKALVRVND